MANVYPVNDSHVAARTPRDESSDGVRIASSQVFEMGVPSSRLELGTLSSSALRTQSWQTAVRQNLEFCRPAIFRQQQFCKILQQTHTSKDNFMFQLENSTFDMACSGISEGCLYGTVFTDGRYKYMRFFESGIYKGFFESKGLDLVKDAITANGNNVFWEKIFTDKDVDISAQQYQETLMEKRKKLDQSKAKSLPVSGKRYKKVVETLQKHLSHFIAQVQTDSFREKDVECLGVLLYVEKKKGFKDKESTPFFSASKCFDSEEFRTACTSHITEGPSQQSGSLDILSPLQSPVSWNLQLKYISSFPNKHKWERNHVQYSQWLSIFDEKGKYKPASARNQILYNFREGNLHEVFAICSKLQNQKNPPHQQASARSTFVCSSIGSDDTDAIPSAAKRRRREPLRRLTMTDLLANVTSIDPEFSSQNLHQERSAYEKFKFALISNGNLVWRHSADGVDIFAMNDVNISTGLFQEDCYVHLTKTTVDGVSDLTCSCSMFTTLMQVASLGLSEEEFDGTDLSEVQCCHIRLFKEMISDHTLSVIQNKSRSENRLVQKLELMKGQINELVCHLPTSSDRTFKFSVYSDHDKRCAFVHVTENRLVCQSGYCDALFSNSKRTVVQLRKADVLCPHLATMKDQIETWIDFLPKPAESEETGSVDEDEDDNDRDQEEDPSPVAAPVVAPVEDLKDHRFNEDTGLWEYPSLSPHVPAADGSLTLQEAMQLRETFNDKAFGRDSEGFLYTGEGGTLKELFPPPSPQSCKCGAGYLFENGQSMAVPHISTVYMMHGPAKYKIWIRVCKARNRQCNIGPGETDAIHFFTKETGAGDEFGWDFIDHVLYSKITFGAYCNIMSKKYSRINSRSAPFMSNKTFIAWWFSWITKFRIDYRRPCRFCKFKPKYLAADGTKIGINVNVAKVTPVETPTVDTTVDPSHRRNNRAFISYSQGDRDAREKAQSRDHLLYHCKKALGTLKQSDEIPLEEVLMCNDKLAEHIDADFLPLVHAFINNQCGNRLLKKLAVLFKILSTNHSLSSVVPFRYLDEFKAVLNEMRANANTDPSLISKVAHFSPEIRDVLAGVKGTEHRLDAVKFFMHFITRVDAIFQNCKEPDAAVPHPGTYNPAKFGRAYYFTPHGNQLRDIPKYTMNSVSANYDDEPARVADKCIKDYEVGRKGVSYLFLWFDPQHYGHCYGYHMIPGHEGRKDPACSAYLYLENAPEEMFYDFSCQLEEYCLNLEPGYWKKTRFFHDTFHGFCHHCAIVYTSSRLKILHKANTEICEQTNAFLQRIRFSARAMSMNKFNHFLQFFLHQWSEIKYENFRKKFAVALNFAS